jgi:polar amino acid transport system substrate-binding protein
MTRRHLALWAALLLPLRAVAGCADAEPDAAAEPAAAAYDEQLHELLPASVRERGVIRVGTDPSYAPMAFFDTDGRTIIGVEPDLGEAIGKVLGVEVQFVNSAFTGLIDAVVAGRFDLAMSAITDTPERAKQVDFVNYFSAGTAILVQKGNPAGITDISDLCGRLVAVERGTVQVDLLERSQGNCDEPIDIRTFATNSDALVKLRTGQAVAVLNDLPPAVFLTTDKRTAAHYQLASTTQYEPGLYGVGVPKDQPQLRAAIEGALEQLLETGVYHDILVAWSVQSGAVDEVTLNSGR